MPKGGQDLYGTYGGVPTIENQGVSNARQDIQVNANSFGGQVGEAISTFGASAQKIGEHFGQMVTEAKVNHDYANQYIPATEQLKSQYDSLRGPDKVAGYDNYIKQLHEVGGQFVSQQNGLLGKQSMQGLVDRHIGSEVQGAQRELVASQKQFSDEAYYDMLKANNKLASQNYDNQSLVNELTNQNDNHILINHIDNGHNPSDSVTQETIKETQRLNRGSMGEGMIGAAISRGDTINANALRANYSDYLPGYMKLSIDRTLNTQNIQQTSTATISAIRKGQPMPEAIGAPPSQVQALVANTAKTSTVDPNNALTVLRIESADGKNLGTRGTLGQDKESAGKSIEEQAKALCDNLRAANGRATNALGRDAEPWEGYVVYQQGAGGGPALLKAAQDYPNAKAIDVLEPLYKNRKDALSALTGNGGNITMSASDFVNHIKDVYNFNAQRANCDFSNTENPGDAIIIPHTQTGSVIQPGATAVQALMNFDSKAPDLIARINAIPNYEVREGVMRAYNQNRNMLQAGATAYKNVLVNQANQLAADPKFTSMEQLSSELYSAFAETHPETLKFLEKMADYNLAKQSGLNPKDAREYGNGINKTLNNIWSGNVTNIAQLHDAVSNGQLTIAGYDRAAKELQGKNTPEGEAEGMMKKQFFANAKAQISGKDEMLNISDPKGEENYLKFLAQVLPAYEKAKGEGKTSAQLLDPDSADYIGKAISSFKRPMAQMLADMTETSDGINASDTTNTATPETKDIRWFGGVADDISSINKFFTGDKSDINMDTPQGLREAVSKGKITRAAAEKIAIERGYIRGQDNKVPLAE